MKLPLFWSSAIVLTLLAGCALDLHCEKQETCGALPLQVDSEADFKAFQDTVYPFLRENCKACHSQEPEGIGQNPMHSQTDPKLAFEAVFDPAKPLINKKDLPASLFFTKLGDGHCGFQCFGNLKPDLETALTAFCKKSGTCGTDKNSDGYTFSAEVLIPSDIPASTTSNFADLSFNLGVISGDFMGIQFQMEIQKYSESSYKIRNPRINFGSQAGMVSLHIEGVRLYINGSAVQGADDLESLNLTVQSGSPLSQEADLISDDLGPGNDQIKVGFKVIQLQN